MCSFGHSFLDDRFQVNTAGARLKNRCQSSGFRLIQQVPGARLKNRCQSSGFRSEDYTAKTSLRLTPDSPFTINTSRFIVHHSPVNFGNLLSFSPLDPRLTTHHFMFTHLRHNNHIPPLNDDILFEVLALDYVPVIKRNLGRYIPILS